MTQFNLSNNKSNSDYLFAENSAEDLKRFIDTSVSRRNKWYSFLVSCLIFSPFPIFYFSEKSDESLFEMLPFFLLGLLISTGSYFYSHFIFNRTHFSHLKNRPLCYVDFHYVYIEFHEPSWKKKLGIPIEQVQLLLGNISDDYYFRSTQCKNKNDEVLLLDFTFVNWQELFDHSELIISSAFGVSQLRTYFFHAPRIVCCVSSTQYPTWYKRFSHCCPCSVV